MTSTKHRLKVIFWYMGQLLVWFPIILLSPVIFVFFYPNEWHYIASFLVPSGVSFALGMILKKVSRLKETHVVGYQEG
ncbi:MAG: potassium transporter, partial [Thermotoga sp.]|nr:potassium transporter [Thermotoga sp.]